MPRRKLDGFCPICGQEIDVVVSNAVRPWFDGKTYSEICFTCHSTVKAGEYVNWDEEKEVGEWVDYHDEPFHIRTVKEMEEDGWTGPEEKKQATISIKAVKAALRKAGKRVARQSK